MDVTSSITFYVNGKKVVENSPQPEWTLLSYLRNNLRLTGTKSGCGEGGCGACTVMISRYDRTCCTIKHYAVNACLTPLCSVHGLAVTTVEGVGEENAGRRRLHAVQERLAKAHGSQCGFCTPGFVMSMYTLLRSNDKQLPSMSEVATSLQGNLCRCTGYRPILDGFRSLTRDECCGGNVNGGGCCMDQVEKNESQAQQRSITTSLTPTEYEETYSASQEPIFPSELQLSDQLDRQFLVVKGQRVAWYRPTELHDLLELKKDHPEAKFVVGNTEIALETKFKQSEYPVLINPSSIHELLVVEHGESLVIGGAVPISTFEAALQKEIQQLPEAKSQVFSALLDMLRWFGSKQIRNVASVAGNVMTASPISDLNPLFVASRCVVKVQSASRGVRLIRMDENFFSGYRKAAVAQDEIMVSIAIPQTEEDEYVSAYKQSRRREDDIAIVNAGFRVRFIPQSSQIEEIALVFGGMAPTTSVAVKTARGIIGRKWEDPALVEDVCGMLLEEFPLPPTVPGGMSSYRQSLCLGFFFKFHQHVGRQLMLRAVFNDYPLDNSFDLDHQMPLKQMKSSQLFELVPKDQPSMDPVGRSIPHRSAEKHTTGEAIYCDDLTPLTGELYMSLVLSTEAHALITSIDSSAALSVEGVHAVFSAKDIDPQRNCFGPVIQDEEVFASEKVTCCGQVVACVIADDPAVAERAARLVRVTYQPIDPVIVTLHDAIQQESFFHQHSRVLANGDVDQALKEAEHVLEGTFQMAGQEHFYMETHSVRVIPKGEDDELDIISTTQIPTDLQKMVAEMLDVPYNRIVSRVKRIGGGFGGKQTRIARMVLPAAFASHRLKRPVRCTLNREEDMSATGNRHPFLAKYKVGFTSNGELIALDVQLYSNAGNTLDSSRGVMEKALLHVDNCYRINHFRASGHVCRTNLPSNTAMRGFGGPQAMAICENIVNDVATYLNVDPLTVREINMYREGDRTPFHQLMEHVTLSRCWTEVKALARVNERRKDIESFNRAHRYKKRGLAVIPTKYGVSFTALFMNQAIVLLHVYKDGSVLLSHGWTEMGQGLDTKLVQVASRVLGISSDVISVSDTSTEKVPNASPSGASTGSDLNGMAVLDACKTIVDRLAPIRQANPAGSWKEWVTQAYLQRISLSTTGFFRTPDIGYDITTNSGGHPYRYFTFGAACSEVEIDCLTGNHRVLRSDIVMDLGESLNPAIDIGQIEGAFVQGMGLFTLEEPLFSPTTGRVITRGPSNYKIPTVDDIPLELNVSLLRGSPNPHAVYSSKAAGEPPLFLASSVFFAIKNAIDAARADAGILGIFRLDSPATVERIRMACQDQFTEMIPKIVTGSFQPWAVST